MSIVPDLDFSPLASLGQVYQKAKQQALLDQANQDIGNSFQSGGGNIDYNSLGGQLIKSGRLGEGLSLIKLGEEAKAGQEFSRTLGGLGQPAGPPQPVAQMPQSAPAQSGGNAPRGIRNNNPLNIESGPFTQGQPGFAGSDGRFARFDDPQQGIDAAGKLLDTYSSKYGLNTVAGIIGRWAPSSDGNDVRGYAASVAGRLGVDPNQPLNLSDPKVKNSLIMAMGQFENGRPISGQAQPSIAMGVNGVPERPDAQGHYGPDAVLASADAPQQAPQPYQVAQAGGGAVPVPSGGQSAPQAQQPQQRITTSENPAIGNIFTLAVAAANDRLSPAKRAIAKSLLDKAIEDSKTPDEVKKYGFYAKDEAARGRTPKSYQEWELELKRAGATMINTAEGEQAAQAKARIAIDTHAIQDLSKKVVAGRAAIPALDRMIAIADKTPAGWAGAVSPYIAKGLASVGIEVPEGISNSELMLSLSRQFIPAVRDPGSTSNYEQSLYQSAVPSLAQSVEGRLKIASMFKSQIARQAEIMQIYRENVGSPNLDKKLAELDAKPVFSPEDRKVLERFNKPQAGSAVAAPQGQDQALPPPKAGDIINGHQFKGGNPKDPNSWAPVT